MFEAIHGSAPRRAGQDLAISSGLLLGGVLMLVHHNQSDIAPSLGKTPHTLKAPHYSAAPAKAAHAGDGLDLLMIANRGFKVRPDGMAATLRNFDGKPGSTLAQGQ